jgi:hypothetical protein
LITCATARVAVRFTVNVPHRDDSLAEAFQTTLGLFDMGVAMMRQNLKRADPAASDEEIDDRLDAWPNPSLDI